MDETASCDHFGARETMNVPRLVCDVNFLAELRNQKSVEDAEID